MNDSITFVIDTHDLTKTFKGGNALQSLNLKVPKNSIFGFLGPNDEKRSGTVAWIMSKPVSRAAFIFAKLVANTFALFVIILVVQGAVAYLQLSQANGSPLPLGPFVTGMALLTLNMVFYLSFTLMLGTLFNDRGPVMGIPIVVLFSPLFIMGYVGQAANLLPWPLVPSGNEPGLAVTAMMGEPLSTTTPVLATIVWIVIFVAVALWRFQREEF